VAFAGRLNALREHAVLEDHHHLLAEYSAVQQALSELAAIYNDAPIGMAVIGTDFRFQRINARLAEMNGAPIEAHIGRTIREVVPTLADIGEGLVRKIAETRKSILNLEVDGETAAEPGVIRSFIEHWSPVFGPDGMVVAVNIVVEEVTAQKRAEERLRQSEQRLSTALRAGQLGVFEYNYRPSPSYYWDRTVRQIWGVGPNDDITDMFFWSALHPDDEPRVRLAFARSEDPAGSRRYDVEYRIFRRSDNALRWVRVASDMIFDGNDPVRIIGTIQDITDQKQTEEQALLLMREVNHRSKNLLAVVQSIAHQMARGVDPATFASGFAERLAGLASCQDLLLGSHWQGVDLAALVAGQLAHYKHLIGTRIHLAGEPVRISASTAQNLGMALHELATNAAKYGALSADGGEVRISWTASAADDEFTISWTEHGGPPVAVPDHRGLGSQIITRLLERSLGGTVVIEFEPSGLSWSARAKASAVLETKTV
jgi:PAS domain S-box-containing protein